VFSDEEFDDFEEDGSWEIDQVASHLWRPAQFLNEVPMLYKNTLHHLGLTIVDNQKRTRMNKSDQILHFRDFTSLKHLEFDIRIVQGRKGHFRQDPPKYIPPSLSNILPESIEVVRINWYDLSFYALHQMLRSLPNHRARFPVLQSISIAMDGTDSILRLDCISEAEKQFQSLKDELKVLGVDLIFEMYVWDSDDHTECYFETTEGMYHQ
jgi:hypothetical protein